MTLTEIAEIVAWKMDCPNELAWGFIDEAVRVIVDELDSGKSVSVRGLGRFRWEHVRARTVSNFGNGTRQIPAGRKLRFTPSKRLGRRKTMSDNEEGMTKLGVVLDDGKVKEAEEGVVGAICPVCGKDLDDAGACPVHGTEPLEPK